MKKIALLLTLFAFVSLTTASFAAPQDAKKEVKKTEMTAKKMKKGKCCGSKSECSDKEKAECKADPSKKDADAK